MGNKFPRLILKSKKRKSSRSAKSRFPGYSNRLPSGSTILACSSRRLQSNNLICSVVGRQIRERLSYPKELSSSTEKQTNKQKRIRKNKRNKGEKGYKELETLITL
jgi:hypothetical protein